MESDMREWKDAPVMPAIVDDAERFYEKERTRQESIYFKPRRDRERAEQAAHDLEQAKKSKPSIEQRLAAKRKAPK